LKTGMIKLFLMTTSVALIINSCSKEVVGYIEVRNHLEEELSGVAWGSDLHLGTILTGEEEGQETTQFGWNYISLEYKGVKYRSIDSVRVDARSSATYIVEDIKELVEE
jgi:hypothetical protein